MLEPRDDNPFGFYENEEFVYKINDPLLTKLKGAWDNPPKFNKNWELDPELNALTNIATSLIGTFSSKASWGWKDPRTTILLPFWKKLIPNLRFVICIRSPLEIAKSLAKRNGMSVQHSVYLWNLYMSAAIRDTEGCPRLFTFYEDYFDNPSAEIEKLVSFCGLQKPKNLKEINENISVALRNHISETHDLLAEKELLAEHKLLYIGLRALANDKFIAPSPGIAHEKAVSENISHYRELLHCIKDEHKTARLESDMSIINQKVEQINFALEQHPQLDPIGAGYQCPQYSTLERYKSI